LRHHAWGEVVRRFAFVRLCLNRDNIAMASYRLLLGAGSGVPGWAKLMSRKVENAVEQASITCDAGMAMLSAKYDTEARSGSSNERRHRLRIRVPYRSILH